MSAKEKRRRRRKAERMGLWAILIACELLAASVPAAATARILVPLGRAVRGYETFGVDWMVVAAVFCTTYALAHKYVCDRIFEEG